MQVPKSEVAFLLRKIFQGFRLDSPRETCYNKTLSNYGKREERVYRKELKEKLKESLTAVLPIVGVVLILSVTAAPIPNSVLVAFLFGGVLLVAGMMFFSLGAELAMEPIGQHMGARLTRTRAAPMW